MSDIDLEEFAEAPEITAPEVSSRPPKNGAGPRTTIKRGPGRPPKEPKDARAEPVSQAQLKSGLYGFFSTIALFLRADVHWQERDFEQMAKGIMIAGRRIPQVLVFVMNVLTPALAVREFLAKIQDIINGRRRQTELDARDQARQASDAVNRAS